MSIFSRRSSTAPQPVVSMGKETRPGVYACRVTDVNSLDGSRPYRLLSDYLVWLASSLWEVADARKHQGPPKPQGIPVVVTHEGFYATGPNGERTSTVQHESRVVLLAPCRGSWEWGARVYANVERMSRFTMFDYALGDRKATLEVGSLDVVLVVDTNSRAIDQ